MKKILIPTDFSKNAWQALNYALTLYDKHFCEFFLLNAYEVSDTSLKSELIKVLSPGKVDNLRVASEEGLVKWSEMLKLKNNAYHRFRTIALEGNPIEVIQRFVDQNEIELIIIGSKGATRSRKVAFGTVALYVMESVRNCPSLVVPETVEMKKPKEIVFATGLKDDIRTEELGHLKEIAYIDNANIAVLHIAQDKEINEEQREQQRVIETQLRELNYSMHVLDHDSIVEGIRLFTESRNSDIITFFNSKHSFFGNVFVQPLVKQLNFHSKVPLLVLHN